MIEGPSREALELVEVKDSTVPSIRPCDGAHVLGGEQPVIGADAAIDRCRASECST